MLPLPGSLTFAEFCATAVALAPINIAVVMPPPKQSSVDQPLTSLISVIVTDTGGNPVSGAPVTFQVEIAGGNFSGEETIVAIANSDGIAEAEWTLEPAVGISNNEASAAFPGNLGFPAIFIVSGVAAGLVEETCVSGIVQNSAGNPLAGVRAVLTGTDLEAFTGKDGSFTIADVLQGGHHVAILGSSANDPINNMFFPDIEFAIEAISGVDNTLDQIVVLPFLDNANAQLTGGDDDVILTMSDVPGFSIKVFANSTFIRDPNTDELVQEPVTLSSSQVKLDKVPMAPPQGSVPLVVGTIQPAGIIFNHPAAVCYPNTAGLAPGDVADIFAFHHDIGSFVSFGPGTVSNNGSVVCSDPGFGLVQSGWHCSLRNPAPTASCANECSTDYSWEILKPFKNGFEIPLVMCMINQSFNPDLPEKEKMKAAIQVVFSPGNGQFIDDSWTIDDLSIAGFCTGGSGNGTTRSVGIQAQSPGATLVRSPTYMIPLPAVQGGDRICQALIEVKVSKVAFDISNPKIKIKIQNIIIPKIDDEKERSKCAMELFDSSTEPVDLCDFLTTDSDKENIIFTVNNSSKGVGCSSVSIATQGGVGSVADRMKQFYI